MNRINIKEVLEELYSYKRISEWEKYGGLLYYYIEDIFADYKELINNIEDKLFYTDSDDLYFKGSFSSKRLRNLIQILVQEYMDILQSCYKGDVFYANKLLYNLLLCKNSKICQYLVEPYINYFGFDVITNNVFYRMRDEYNGEEVKDCSHVPFNLRKKIDSNRFGLQGLPCLYLADSKKTAEMEIRPLEEGKTRWISEFVPLKLIPVLDLRFYGINIPSNLGFYDAFKLLITFPMRLLCSIKVKNEKDNFHEEYYFPQLLSHLILVYLKEHTNDRLYHGAKGIMFDSTQNIKGFNIIIPASYRDKKPPKSGQSQMIKELFIEQNLQLYDNNATPTTKHHLAGWKI